MATSEPLNVIALISGGKDSLYSILHCMRNGHRIVALANLRPATKTASASSLVVAGDEERRDETRGKDSREDEDDGREEDVDSFMYQTIGHNVIPLYESALGIPLYREEITGGAVDTARIYGEDSSLTVTEREAAAGGGGGGGINDETECLIPLLTRIKRDIPHANAVSAGAILSTYQRTRIENVAARLGLVPLAFLWMYPSLPPAFAFSDETEVDGIEAIGEVARRAARAARGGGLLDDMAAVGCDARIIKVASGGLDADVLWENVASAKTRKRLEKLMRPFVDDDDVRALKGAVLGEGGEYETLALDGPAFLWKKKIVVAEMDREVCRDEGGVSHVRVLRARCEEKTVDEDSTSISLNDIPRPDRFDKKFAQLLSNLLDRQVQEIVTDDDAAGCTLSTKIASEPGPRHTTANVSLNLLENLLAISNVTAPEAGPTAEAQMRGIVAKLRIMLAGSDSHAAATTSDVVFTTVLLRSMQDFAGMNKEYVGLFTKPNPPARVTVACGSGLPEGVQIMVSLIVDRGQRERRDGLHVQSRSYWAPANIGPYSQAITVPCHANRNTPDDDTDNHSPGALVYVAGQIPLDPASMEIADGGVKQSEELWLHNFSLHATLSLQHLWRIGLATKVDWWIGGAVVFLARDNHHRGARKAQIATGIWQAIHSRQSNDAGLSEEEDPALDVWDIKHGLAEDPRLSRDEDELALPNYQAIIDDNHESSQLAPPCFVVEVEQLPRNSDIEWQALGYSGGLKSIHGPVRIPCNSDSATKIWCTRLGDSRTSFYTIEIANKEDESPDSKLQHRIDAIFTELGIDVHRRSLALCTIYSSCALSLARWSGQVVPCYNAWGSDGKDLAAAITVQLGANEMSVV